jgi:two-component system, chemotaxis family, sensor kinase CheA
MIDDSELRALFQAESDDHLQSLDDGLLRLEADVGDSDTLQRIFRDAHSLKGSARMLGIAPVEQVAHRFEDVLGAARRGETPLTPAVVSRLYETLDTIRALVGEAVTGISARISVPAVLAGLDDLERLGAAEGDESEAPSTPEEPGPPEEAPHPTSEQTPSSEPASPPLTDASETLPAPTVPPSAPAPVTPTRPVSAAPRQGEAFRVETIRVDSRKLDDLMLRAGELVVTGGRIEQRARNVAHVGDRWAELYRDIVASESGAASSAGATTRASTRAAQARTRMREVADDLEGLIVDLKQDTHDDRTRLDNVVSRIEEGIRSASLLPLSTVFGLIPGWCGTSQWHRARSSRWKSKAGIRPSTRASSSNSKIL